MCDSVNVSRWPKRLRPPAAVKVAVASRRSTRPTHRGGTPLPLRLSGISITLILLMAHFLLLPSITKGGERELWSFWKKHSVDVENHADMVSLCQTYAQRYPDDSFLPVIRSMEAWHQLHLGKTEEARRLLLPQLEAEADALERGAQRLARSWMTRLEREKVVAALQYYYRKEVRYPSRLEELVSFAGMPDAKTLPLKDTWGRTWRYRLVGYKGMPGFLDQKYSLGSSSIQPPMDAAKAVLLPYAKEMNLQPIRVGGGGAPGVSVVKLEYTSGPNQGQSAVGQVGEEVEGFTVAYAGSGLVLLCDSLHWNVLRWK